MALVRLIAQVRVDPLVLEGYFPPNWKGNAPCEKYELAANPGRLEMDNGLGEYSARGFLGTENCVFVYP